MNVNVYNVSAINPLDATYYDPFYTVRQYKEVYEQGFTFNKIEALNSVVDSTINNYTTQYLTSKKSLDDIFTIDYTPDAVKTITTPLIFGTQRNLTKYLYIYRDTVQNFPNATTHRVLLTSFTGFKNNIYFELEFIGNLYVRVKHNNGDNDYYMNYLQQQDSVVFLKYSSNVSSVSAEGPDTFRYLLDPDGYLQLFKKTETGNKILTLSAIQGNEDDGILSFIDVVNTGSYSGTNSIIKINYNIQTIRPKTYSSWVSYDINKQNDLIIDTARSTFDRKDQYLIHANINESSDKLKLNYVTLNNTRSEKNFIKRGATLSDTVDGTPDVEFREYNSLQTGNNQEHGDDNITLTYTWYDKDILVLNGSDTYFTAPSSIYPYTRLNVNDTKFVENGSLAGLSPKLSDNIFQLRKNISGYNNGRYLCTWLSGGNNRERGLWVDRYYYPDIVTKEQALTGIPVFEPSFFDPIDNINNINKSTVAAIAYFDKRSDLCIEPNGRYKYARIGADDISSFIDSSAPIASGFNNFYTTNNVEQPYNSNEIVYTGTTYNKFNVSQQINVSNSFSVSFDIFLDPQKKYGYQILGNNTNKGFGVTSDEQITPFIFTYEGKKLVVYNTDLVKLYTTVFDTQVLDVIKGKGLDDFFVSCNNGNLYKLNTLGVKQKQERVPQIVNYVNYCLTEDAIYFLTNSKTDDVVVVDRNTLEVIEITSAKRYNSYKSSNFASDKYSLVVYNNTPYKLAGREVKYFAPDVVYYVVSDKTLIRHDIKIDDITYILESDSEIVDFAIDKSNIYVIHGNKKPKLSVFDLSLDLVSETRLSTVAANSTFISIDLIKQFPAVNKQYLSTDIVITYLDEDAKLNLYTVNGKRTVNTQLQGEKPDKNSNKQTNKRYIATNYSYFNQFVSPPQLNFNLTLVNYLSTEDILRKTITFDYSSLDRGYHTFTYRFDPIQGNITLFVDGNLYTNLTVQPGKYAIQEILNDDFYAGTAGFYNNMDLATYLKQPGYYFSTDIRLRNLFIYDRPLLDDEVSALDILSTQINDICLSIPAGQRNNIEEIVRYFRYKAVDSSSKQISIYIKNANIANSVLRDNIRNLILEEASSILPIGVNINSIQFVDFK